MRIRSLSIRKGAEIAFNPCQVGLRMNSRQFVSWDFFKGLGQYTDFVKPV